MPRACVPSALLIARRAAHDTRERKNWHHRSCGVLSVEAHGALRLAKI